jgi:predicted PhzF superfamily epimerase YddE/YHI9
MTKIVKTHIFRVFANQNGEFGNPVGIVLDENQDVNPVDRQCLATKFGFSESVFINNMATGKVSIFNPKREVNFAGHALVGTAYFIGQILKKPIKFLECNIGQIQTWQNNGLTWIRASLKGTPPWTYKQLEKATQVDNLTKADTTSLKHMVVWAWIDEDKGIVRARTFAPDWGIPEDEANGSGSMQLASMTNKSLEIHHGKGSVIYSKPIDSEMAEVGGRVMVVE